MRQTPFVRFPIPLPSKLVHVLTGRGRRTGVTGHRAQIPSARARGRASHGVSAIRGIVTGGVRAEATGRSHARVWCGDNAPRLNLRPHVTRRTITGSRDSHSRPGHRKRAQRRREDPYELSPFPAEWKILGESPGGAYRYILTRERTREDTQGRRIHSSLSFECRKRPCGVVAITRLLSKPKPHSAVRSRVVAWTLVDLHELSRAGDPAARP